MSPSCILCGARGVAHLVVHGTSDSTSYETIPPVRLESSGGVLSTVDMVVQRRDHDDDDDDDDDDSVRRRQPGNRVRWIVIVCITQM